MIKLEGHAVQFHQSLKFHGDTVKQRQYVFNEIGTDGKLPAGFLAAVREHQHYLQRELYSMNLILKSLR